MRKWPREDAVEQIATKREERARLRMNEEGLGSSERLLECLVEDQRRVTAV